MKYTHLLAKGNGREKRRGFADATFTNLLDNIP